MALTDKSETPDNSDPSFLVGPVPIEEQTWYRADDNAIAREFASPRNSRARTLSIADIILPAGIHVRPHYHVEIEEIYHVISGAGMMHLAGRDFKIVAGDTIVILPGERHGVHNREGGDLRMTVTCSPPWTPDCMLFD